MLAISRSIAKQFSQEGFSASCRPISDMRGVSADKS
jgi:hypothetical protein